MNLRDLNEITIRLSAAVHHLHRLEVMVNVYQFGKVIIAEEEMPLTNGQRAGIKTKAQTLGARLTAGADTLTNPTGKTGTSDLKQVAEIQVEPRRLFRILQDLTAQTESLTKLLLDTTSVETDGSIAAPVADETAQQTANAMATLRDAAKWWITQELAKLT